MSALALCALLLAASGSSAAQSARLPVKPSLECSCRSTHAAGDRFDLNCQRIAGADLGSGTTGSSTFSCAHRAAGGVGGEGGGGGDWRWAEVRGRGVYSLSVVERSWDDARAACSAKGQLLAPLVGGADEAKALLKAFEGVATSGNQLFWVGIRYYEDVSKFYTTLGKPMGSLPWTNGQPSIRKDQNCVALGREAKLHGPHGCRGKRKFFCVP